MGKGIKQIFRKVLGSLFNLLPKTVRIALLRKLVTVPDACLNHHYVVKVAYTHDEIDQALKLLHDCYVAKGLMKPDPSGMRRNLYTDLAQTTILIVKDGRRVIGTLTLIKDGELGLPSDKDFKNENESLRINGRALVEVSALAVDPNFRQKGNAISLLMMKFLYHYTKAINGNHLICTVHPRVQEFYEALWGFERKGGVVKYPFVNGALAIHMNLELSETSKQKNIAMFSSQDPKRNPALWVLNSNVRHLIPIKSVNLVSNTQLQTQNKGRQSNLVAFPSQKANRLCG